jgi:hypothetical protein
MRFAINAGRSTLAALLTLGLMAAPALSSSFNGVNTSVQSGQTTSTGGTFLGGTVTGTSGGGPGTEFDSRSYNIGEGEAFAEADIDGILGGDVASPLLRASSTGVGTEHGSQSFAGAMVGYVYDGAAPGTVTYDLLLTADLVEPEDTAAFIRARAGFILDPEFYDASYNVHAESSATIADSFSFTQSIGGAVNEVGSISFVADPGQVFYLAVALTTQAGKSGASSDASSTFSGLLTAEGGVLTVVPEPGTLMMMMLGCAVFAMRRRVAS